MLDNASFTAEDGKVTGFLGSNGAGKSTTMRAALGLVTPNAGRALVDGVPFVKTPSPMTAVGSVLDAKSAHKVGPPTPICVASPLPTAYRDPAR